LPPLSSEIQEEIDTEDNTKRKKPQHQKKYEMSYNQLL
jgi:hypothetical protein